MQENNSHLLIVQPWFTAVGHPAQSLLNTARVLGTEKRVSYLISDQVGETRFLEVAEQLREYGQVETFCVPSSSLRICTLLSMKALFRSRKERLSILFLDAHLVVLALLWGWVSPVMNVQRLSVVYLMGPEKIASNWFADRIIRSFLSRLDTRLYLRTEELAESWKKIYQNARIEVLPSLELPEIKENHQLHDRGEKIRFGILGQIRPGKGIEWLVPLFEQRPEIGKLTVAGTFFTHAHEKALAVLGSSQCFVNRFLTEHDMLALASSQDYLLMLYDNWDARMEAATLYLAAKVNRPVIARDAGWCGRMIRAYNCGVICENGSETAEFFQSLPVPGEPAYERLLLGLERFRKDHSGSTWRQRFIEKVFQS